MKTHLVLKLFNRGEGESQGQIERGNELLCEPDGGTNVLEEVLDQCWVVLCMVCQVQDDCALCFYQICLFAVLWCRFICILV